MARFFKFWVLLFASIFLLQCSNNGSGPDDDIPELEDVLLEDEIRINPTGYAPLTATISIQTDMPVQIEAYIPGKEKANSISHTFEKVSAEHEVPILGLYPDHRNLVELTFYTENKDEIGTRTYTIGTDPLIDAMPEIDINVANTGQMAEGWTHVSYFGHAENGNNYPQRPFIFDTHGDIRWYLDFSEHPELNELYYDDGVERLQNGNLYFGDGTTNTIYEVNMLGEVLNTWDMPGYGFHHEVLEKPNGNFLVTVNKLDEETIEDFIIEIDREQNTIVNVWDLKESLQYSRRALTDDDTDWFHANAVVYSEQDDCIIVSGRTQGMVKLTNDNEVVWIMGPHLDWEKNGRGEDLNEFLLQPLDAAGSPITDQEVLDGYENHPDFEWNWYQHAPQIMPNGNIMLFDNGDNRNFSGHGPYSRAVEYKVDEEEMTIQQVWQYGKERGEQTYSRIVSDVDYFPEEDHVFFSPGAITHPEPVGKVVEVDYETGNRIFEATITPPAAMFSIVTFHRTERLPIYPR